MLSRSTRRLIAVVIFISLPFLIVRTIYSHHRDVVLMFKRSKESQKPSTQIEALTTKLIQASKTTPKQAPPTTKKPTQAPTTRKSVIPLETGVKDLCSIVHKGIEVNAWWKYVCLIEKNIDKPLGYKCKTVKIMGNWPVCFDEKFTPIRPNKPCLVYSFGIAWDFSFDDAMAAKGCEVYSFDPSMGLKDHTHGTNVTFKSLGLSHMDDDSFNPRFDIYVKKEQKWKIRTLRSVMKMLKHEKRVIDVLKFDIEIAEWEVMINIIKDNMLPKIRQLLTEWHIFPSVPPRDRLQTFYEMHRDLPSNGLEAFHNTGHTRIHKEVKKFNTQAEACYVNVNFKDPE